MKAVLRLDYKMGEQFLQHVLYFFQPYFLMMTFSLAINDLFVISILYRILLVIYLFFLQNTMLRKANKPVNINHRVFQTDAVR